MRVNLIENNNGRFYISLDDLILSLYNWKEVEDLSKSTGKEVISHLIKHLKKLEEMEWKK